MSKSCNILYMWFIMEWLEDNLWKPMKYETFLIDL